MDCITKELNQKLQNFLDNYENDDNFLDTITEISKCGPNDDYIINDSKLLSMDKICDHVHNELCGARRNKPKHSSVDAIKYVISNDIFKTFFIEFKRVDLDKESAKKILEKLIEEIINDNSNSVYKSFLGDLNFIKNSVGKEISLDLKLKPFESLYSIIPHLYDIYVRDNDFEDTELMKYFLNDCKHTYIVVSNVYSKSSNKSNRQQDLKRSFKSIHRLAPKVFEKVELFDEKEINKFISKLEYYE